MTVEFYIPGEPVGKGRPRFTRTGRTYTPEATANYETLVKIEYQRQVGLERFPDDAALKMEIEAQFSIPKSASRKKTELMATGVIRPIKKPDWDNIGKIVADSLNGIAYRDDSQITEAAVWKRYTESTPCVWVRISEVDHETDG